MMKSTLGRFLSRHAGPTTPYLPAGRKRGLALPARRAGNNHDPVVVRRPPPPPLLLIRHSRKSTLQADWIPPPTGALGDPNRQGLGSRFVRQHGPRKRKKRKKKKDTGELIEQYAAKAAVLGGGGGCSYEVSVHMVGMCMRVLTAILRIPQAFLVQADRPRIRMRLEMRYNL